MCVCVWVCVLVHALIDAWKPRSIIIHFQTLFFTFSLDGWTWSDHCCLSVGGLGHLWGVCVCVYTCMCMHVICLTGQWSICLSNASHDWMYSPTPTSSSTTSMWKSEYFSLWVLFHSLNGLSANIVFVQSQHTVALSGLYCFSISWDVSYLFLSYLISSLKVTNMNRYKEKNN